MRSLILSAVLAIGALGLIALPASAYTPRYYSQFHEPYGTVYAPYPSSGGYYGPYAAFNTYPVNPGYGYYNSGYNSSNMGSYNPYTYNPGYSYYNPGYYGR